MPYISKDQLKELFEWTFPGKTIIGDVKLYSGQISIDLSSALPSNLFILPSKTNQFFYTLDFNSYRDASAVTGVPFLRINDNAARPDATFLWNDSINSNGINLNVMSSAQNLDCPRGFFLPFLEYVVSGATQHRYKASVLAYKFKIG